MRNVLLPLAMSLDLDPLGWENLWKFAVRFFYVENMWRNGIVSNFYGIYDAPAKPLFG